MVVSKTLFISESSLHHIASSKEVSEEILKEVVVDIPKSRSKASKEVTETEMPAPADESTPTEPTMDVAC